MPTVEPDFGDRYDGHGRRICEWNAAIAMVQPDAGEASVFHAALGVLAARHGRKDLTPDPHWREALRRFQPKTGSKS